VLGTTDGGAEWRTAFNAESVCKQAFGLFADRFGKKASKGLCFLPHLAIIATLFRYCKTNKPFSLWVS